MPWPWRNWRNRSTATIPVRRALKALRTFGRPFFLLLLLAGTASNCAGGAVGSVPSHQTPLFTDDSSCDSLKEAIRINLDYLAKQPSGKSARIAGRTVP